jgi:hypothetical protein
MKHAIFIYTTWAFWLSACTHVIQKDDTTNRFEELWNPILLFLNQGPAMESRLSEDLSDRYLKELAHIETQWSKSDLEMTDSKKKHEFFHEHLAKLNSDEQIIFSIHNQKQESRRALLTDILHRVESHPVTGSKRDTAYDNQLQIGFCFGRALLTHYYLRKAGVSQKDIMKVFALGDFKMAGQFWHFHVAVVVNDNGQLTVIDPLYGDPATIQDWMANVQSLEIKHPFSRARFYLTDPRKFMPTSGNYDTRSLQQDGLEQYFHDLALTLR